MAVIHMACIKEVNRSASFAPGAPFLAAGKLAGLMDVHFSLSANLDIFKLDFTSVEHQLPLAGSEPSSESFNRLSWGKYPTNSEEFSLGLIAGGLVDETIWLEKATLIGAFKCKAKLGKCNPSH